MRSHHLLIGMMGLAVLVAAYFLLPRAEERATMFARDGYYETALKELSGLQNAGDPNVLIQTHLLREMQGDHDGALKVLEAYLSIRPDDLSARERQAELILQSGQTDGYLDALARLVARHPTAERVTLLLELYRLHDRIDDELNLLRTYAGSKYLGLALLERLGALLAGQGDWDGARRWLSMADKNAAPDASAGRLLLFDVLLLNNRFEEAYQRARTWIYGWRNPYLSGKLLVRMAQAELGAQEADVAWLCVDAMPEATFELTMMLTNKGYAAISRQMLTRWAERAAKPTPQQLRDYIYASVQAGDAQGPFRKMVQLIRLRADPLIQARLAEELAHAYGFLALSPLRTQLSTKVLLARPLFGGELAIFEGNLDLAHWFLTQADPSQIAPEDRLPWLKLLRGTEPRNAAFSRLAQLWHQKRLPPELLRPLAEEAKQLGQSELHDAIWQSFGGLSGGH
jgi:hypothetical protein